MKRTDKDELTYLEEDANDVAKEFFHSYII